MDFDFSTIFYIAAAVFYSIYSWMSKKDLNEKKLPKQASGEQSELPKPQSSGKDAESGLPGWLRDLLDENYEGQQTPGQSKPAAQPTQASVKPEPESFSNRNGRFVSAPATQRRKASSDAYVRHRDSQEALQSDAVSLEYVGPENRSLEEVVSPYDAFSQRSGTNPVETEAAKANFKATDSGLTSESAGYLQSQDLRRAIIWSEILKPHPEQATHLH